MKKITKGEVKFRSRPRTVNRNLRENFFKQDKVAAFWKAFRRAYKTEETTVRRPSSEELRNYWAMISFDIEEPLFVVQSKIALDSRPVRFVAIPQRDRIKGTEESLD